MQPDMAGFKEAQARLINEMNDSVVLLTPVAGIYPAGTKLDPETLKPLDPWVRAASASFASATARASIAFQPIKTDAQDSEGALGTKGTLSVAVIMEEEHYIEVEGDEATELVFADRRYRIEDRVKDPLPNHRILYAEPL